MENDRARIIREYMPKLAPPTPQERFDTSRDYWSKAVEEGRLHDNSFFRATFYGPDSESLRSSVDDDMMLTIAKELNKYWVGNDSHPESYRNHNSNESGING